MKAELDKLCHENNLSQIQSIKTKYNHIWNTPNTNIETDTKNMVIPQNPRKIHGKKRRLLKNQQDEYKILNHGPSVHFPPFIYILRILYSIHFLAEWSSSLLASWSVSRDNYPTNSPLKWDFISECECPV